MEPEIKIKLNNNHKYYYIETFGCQMNEFDSERIKFLFESDGYVKSTRPEEADVIILNTCAVRKKAENRLFGHIGNLKSIKSSKPDLIICIGGCAAQTLKKDILVKFPFVDVVFGTKNLYQLPEFINDKIEYRKSICNTGEYEKDLDSLYKFNRNYFFKAFLPVMVGCNNYCTYCIVPYVRGNERSVKPDIILAEANKLVQSGVLELILLGQNVNSYGNDFVGDKSISFSELLKDIAQIKGLKRIRFMTSHPKDFSDSLIDVIRNHNNIMNHIHLPLQAGSDKILEMMNRKYTRDDYINLFHKIKSAIPDCSITTDIIVGFPGETEDDFRQTLDLVTNLRFHRAFTFIYSVRQGTLAEKLNDTTHQKDKKLWFQQLVETQNRVSLEENKKYIGKNFKVLVESYSTKTNELLEGRLENNIIVNFKGCKDLIGKIRNIKITDAKSFYLTGRIAENNRAI